MDYWMCVRGTDLWVVFTLIFKWPAEFQKSCEKKKSQFFKQTRVFCGISDKKINDALYFWRLKQRHLFLRQQLYAALIHQRISFSYLTVTAYFNFNTWTTTNIHPLKISQPAAGTDPSGTHKFKFSSCHSWLRNPSPRPAPSFHSHIFISFKPYLWARWERPLELCLRPRSGSHQMADSVPLFLPSPLRWTAGPWSRLRFLDGRSSGSLCLTRTAGRLLDQLPGNTGVPGCCCVQDNNLVCRHSEVFFWCSFLTVQSNCPLMVLIYTKAISCNNLLNSCGL